MPASQESIRNSFTRRSIWEMSREKISTWSRWALLCEASSSVTKASGKLSCLRDKLCSRRRSNLTWRISRSWVCELWMSTVGLWWEIWKCRLIEKFRKRSKLCRSSRKGRRNRRDMIFVWKILQKWAYNRNIYLDPKTINLSKWGSNGSWKRTSKVRRAVLRKRKSGIQFPLKESWMNRICKRRKKHRLKLI